MKPLEPKAPSDSVIYHKLSKKNTTANAQRKSPLTHGYPHTSGGLLAILMVGWDANHYLFVVQTNSGTGANHYSFVVQTYSGTGCKPILLHESTYIGRHRDLYSFVVGPILVSPPTNIGRFISL